MSVIASIAVCLPLAAAADPFVVVVGGRLFLVRFGYNNNKNPVAIQTVRLSQWRRRV